jgi:hypothetical protein
MAEVNQNNFWEKLFKAVVNQVVDSKGKYYFHSIVRWTKYKPTPIFTYIEKRKRESRIFIVLQTFNN